MHVVDAATGTLVGRRSGNGGTLGIELAAAEHAFFATWPQDGLQGAVAEIDESGDVVRTFMSPTGDQIDHFGVGVAVVGGSVFIGAPNAAFPAGRVYRFDAATGAFAGEIVSGDGFPLGFGAPLTPRDDGLLVGEPFHPAIDEDPLGATAGVVQLVDAATGGLRWTFVNPDRAPPFALFGRPIVSVDRWVAVGDLPRGALYVFADLVQCGNGTVDVGERCDDGNLTSGDGCDANCTPTACGNGIQTAGESCDDGNQLDGDTCGSTCTVVCGDGVLDGAEECDDANRVDGDGCDHDCSVTRCGNGIVTLGEDCDDGNTADGDGCPSDCHIVVCGDGVVEGGEDCDDGNTVDGDGCPSDCHVVVCGDGVVEGGEGQRATR